MSATDSRSLPELLSNLVNDLTNLVRKESELVRAEVSEKIGIAAKASATLAIGAALALGAFLLVLAAVVLALSKVMDPLWATLLVAIVAGIGAYLMIKAALRQVQPAAMAPDRSARQIQKDIHLVKGQAQ